jgi:hypothetical protein
MRIEIIESLIADLERTKKFRKIYKNTIPMWNEVKDFPAVGVVYESDQMDRSNLVNSKAFTLATIPIFVYNKQRGSDVEDNLSELVEVVQKVVESNQLLKTQTIEAMITDFKRDGGMLMPYSVAQLILKVKYIKRLV